MNRTWHETAWTEPEPGPDLGPVQQVQVPNLGPEPNFGIANLEFFLHLPPHLPKAPLTLPLQCMHSIDVSTSTAR